jgi:hypothetical protein
VDGCGEQRRKTHDPDTAGVADLPAGSVVEASVGSGGAGAGAGVAGSGSSHGNGGEGSEDGGNGELHGDPVVVVVWKRSES